MRTYASYRVKRKRKSEPQMLLISGGDIGAPNTTTKVRETFRQITQKLWATKT